MSINEKSSTIGKYVRPIFWALSFSGSLWLIFEFFSKLFLGKLPTWGWGLGDIFLLFLSFLLVFVIFIVSFYRVTHPYINKEEYDSSNENWTAFLFIVIFLSLVQWLPHYFFGVGLLDIIFPGMFN